MTDVDWELLFRYLGRECTPEERHRAEEWLSADARHRVILESAVMAAGRVLEEASRGPQLVVGRESRRTRWVLAAAASLIIALGGGLIWRAAVSANGASARGSSMRTAATGRGERDTLRLEDGTRVVLGATSELRYAASFGAGPRDVYLTGEAYFEVAHDERRPFRVHAGDATAEDLGTTFGVRAYPGDSIVGVVVAEGKVALGIAAADPARGAILSPGQLGRLARGATVPSVQHVDVGAYLGWTRGQLSFDDAPLGDVVRELARWYDAEFRITDPSVASRRLTGTFSNAALPELLDMLAPVLDVRFERRGDTVFVRRSTRSP